MGCNSSTKKANALLKKYAALIPQPDFQPPIQLLSYIWQMDNISKCIHPRGSENWKYLSFESILLDTGRFFKTDRTIDFLRTDIDHRFKYAQNQQDADTVYVEGVVLKPDGVAFEHAWVLNRLSGNILDFYFAGSCYFGIPLNQSFVNKFNNGYGVFSPENGMELLRGGLPEDVISKI